MNLPPDPRPPRRPDADPRYAPPELDESAGERLMEYLDGRLAPDEAAAVEAWLAEDHQARRLAEEHRRLWEALGDAAEVPEPSPAFASETVARARREEAERPLAARLRARGVFFAAAVLVVGVAGFAFWSAGLRTERSLFDQAVIGHLHVLSELPFLEAHGEAIDIALDAELMAAFQGEERGR